jgi:two-component system sensor histidine kinase EvgS
MARLMRLFTQNDVPGLANLAHRIKGGARIIKAQGLIGACERLETACEVVNPAQLTEAVDELHQAMERLAQRLA